MKATINTFAKYIMLAVFALGLGACDSEDEYIAGTLDGIWEGEVASEYFSYRWGMQTEYQAVDIQFYTDPYRYAEGTGVEYDYQRNGLYTQCYFNFEVYNRIIYLDYDDGSQVAIRNYRLNNNYFSGEFIDYNTNSYLASFNFAKVSDWRYNKYTRSGDIDFKKVPSPLQTNK